MSSKTTGKHLPAHLRKHHNKTGRTKIKNGTLEKNLKRLAKELNISYGGAR